MMRPTKKEISEYCGSLELHMRCLIPKFRIMRPEWPVGELSLNLMEFGRGQVSGIGEPCDSDIEFYNRYAATLAEMDEPSACACAYFAGCMMGLVQLGELLPEDFIPALELSRCFVLDGMCSLDLASPKGRGIAKR